VVASVPDVPEPSDVALESFAAGSAALLDATGALRSIVSDAVAIEPATPASPRATPGLTARHSVAVIVKTVVKRWSCIRGPPGSCRIVDEHSSCGC
jgi:hypothetical protein